MSSGGASGYDRGRGGSYGWGGNRANKYNYFWCCFIRGSPVPKPVEVGKEYEIVIAEIGWQRDGVARLQGYVTFVKNWKVKQNVKVKVEQVGNRFWYGNTCWIAIKHFAFPQKRG